MKRTTWIAALTGAALLLAGCSSKSGTATPASSTPSVASSTSAASSSAPAASSTASSAPASSEAASSAPASSEAASSAPESSAAGGDTAASSPQVTKTLGDTSTGLDAQSTVWFTAFCGGLAPVVQISSSLSATGGSTDTAAEEKKLITLFGTLGTTMTTTASTLKKLPPPTFNGGAEFATKVETAFGTAGPAISAEAKKIATDPASLATSMTGLSDSLTKAVQPLDDLSSLQLTPQTQAAIEAIPACAKAKSLSGG